MSELLVVKRKDLEEALDMLGDALALLDNPDSIDSKDELVSIIEYVYSKLREMLRTKKKEVGQK